MNVPELWLVAAVARNRVIGVAGDLPWHLPADLAHFKRLTQGGTLLMGRRTWESIGGQPLPGRRILVLASRPLDLPPSCVQVASVDQALALCQGLDRLWVAGGQAVYEETLPRATGMELTRIDLEPRGDTLFPEWDPTLWDLEEARPHPGDAAHGCGFTFERWRRRGK